MGRLTTADGVGLHVEEVGAGEPVLFIHEFAGDHRSWEPQVRALGRQYRCVSYAARGYPPSDVPADLWAYSQDHAVSDALAVLDGLGIGQTHVVGLSMGGFCGLHLARLYPERVRSLVVAGTGYGAPYDQRDSFIAECTVIADAFEREGAAEVAKRYAFGPARVQFERKDPRGHAEFTMRLAEHSSIGSAYTMRGFQRARPSLFDFADEFAGMTVPILVMAGDEDEGCLEPSLWLKRTIPTAGLVVVPCSGHTLNLEEPALFTRHVAQFLSAVDTGSWRPRDPRARSTSTTGMTS